jgi:hypothetical protein
MSGFEQVVRPFVAITSTPKPRDPETPMVVDPQAFIRWGSASTFTSNDFAEESAGDFNTQYPPELPFNGSYTEEGRRWTDFRVQNPEDPEQFVIVRKTSELALRAPPIRREDTAGRPYTAVDQIRFTFKNAYTEAEDPPGYLTNEAGEEFKPVVLDPLTQIVGVGWPQAEFFLITLMFEHRLDVRVGAEVANPKDSNVNTWGGMGTDENGNPLNEGDPIKDANGQPIVDENGEEERVPGDSNPATALLLEYEGIVQLDADQPGNWTELVPEDPYPFETPERAELPDRWAIPPLMDRGFQVILNGPPKPFLAGDAPERDSFSEAQLKWCADHHVPFPGAQGSPYLPSTGQPYNISQVLEESDGAPVAWKLAAGTEYVLTGYTSGPDPTPTDPWAWGNFPYQVITDSGVFIGLPDGGNVWVYRPWTPAYKVRHGLMYKWAVIYINGYEIFKRFRSFYAGLESGVIPPVPEPMEVNIMAGESAPPDNPSQPSGFVYARWAWYKGLEALEAFAAWDHDLYPPSEETEGSGEGGGPG